MLHYYNHSLNIIKNDIFNLFKSFNLKSFFIFFPYIAFFFLVNSLKWNSFYDSLNADFFINSKFYKIYRIYKKIFKFNLKKHYTFFNDNIITFFSKSVNDYIFILDNFSVNGISLMFCFFFNCFITIELSYTLDDTFSFVNNEFSFFKDNFLKFLNNDFLYNNNYLKIFLYFFFMIRCVFFFDFFLFLTINKLCKIDF